MTSEYFLEASCNFDDGGYSDISYTRGGVESPDTVSSLEHGEAKARPIISLPVDTVPTDSVKIVS